MPDPTTSRRSWLMVGVACGCVFVILAVTAGAIAVLPDMAADLGASQSEVQWIGDGFPLLIAALLLPAGALLDRFGRKRGLLLGLVVLAIGLAMTAVSDSVGLALAGRCVAGVGGAFVFPATLATITAVLGPDERSTAVALWAFTMVLGAVGGLVMCAALTQAGAWQDCFVVLAAMTVLLLVLSVMFIPETRAEDGVPTDPPGAVLSALAIGGITFAVTEAPVHGWTGPSTLIAGGAGLLLLVAFVLWERRAARPMLDVGLFAEPRFGTASVALFVMFIGHFGMYFLSFQYLTYVLGYDALKAALGVAAPCSAFALTPLSPALARRFGARRVVLVGLVLGVIGTATCVTMAAAGEQSYWTFAAGAFVVWLGMSVSMAPPTELIVAAVPESKQGIASAVNDLTRELGAAVGIAIAGSAFNSAYRSWIEDRADQLPGIRGAAESPAAAVQGVARQGGDPGALDVIHDAITAGWQWAFAVLAVGFVIGALSVARRMPGGGPPQTGAAAAAGAVR